MTGLTQTTAGKTFYTEVGLRQEGGADWNPDGLGAWMVSMLINLDAGPNDHNVNDLHGVQMWTDRNEQYLDVADCTSPVIGAPIGPQPASFGLHFDRDGTTAQRQAHPLDGPGKSYDTKGIYQIELCYRAQSASLGTLCPRVNGLAPGLYRSSWEPRVPDIYPAGLGFAGEMTRMQLFLGAWAQVGAGGTTQVRQLEVFGCPAGG